MTYSRQGVDAQQCFTALRWDEALSVSLRRMALLISFEVAAACLVIVVLIGCGDKPPSVGPNTLQDSIDMEEGSAHGLPNMLGAFGKGRQVDAGVEESDPPAATDETRLIEMLFDTDFLDDTAGVVGQVVSLNEPRFSTEQQTRRLVRFRVEERFWGTLPKGELELIEFKPPTQDFPTYSHQASGVQAVLSHCLQHGERALKLRISYIDNKSLGHKILTRGRELDNSGGIRKGYVRRCEPQQWSEHNGYKERRVQQH